MPYVSKAQRRYFHANKEKLEKEGVNVSEWDKATGDKPLPERLGKTKGEKAKDKLKRGMAGKPK